MAQTVESWSDFIREPTRVLPMLEKGGDVVLRRRDGESVVLSMQSRANRSQLGTELAARFVSEIFKSNASPEVAAEAALASRYSWVHFLPADARASFLREFLTTVQACASVGNMTRLGEMIADWKATAEIYSDPKLVAELSRPLTGTGIPVPRPAATRPHRAKTR
ncbi:MAG: hypothetical protein SGI86_00040 [Deltaproteobacteria bacterium]|nr:hypothetical protein [Deltaproteobacteria bacterium]